MFFNGQPIKYFCIQVRFFKITKKQQTMDQVILQQAANVEAQLDSEINRLENLDGDDLARIRQNRIEEMKRGAAQKLEWEKLGRVFRVVNLKFLNSFKIFPSLFQATVFTLS